MSSPIMDDLWTAVGQSTSVVFVSYAIPLGVYGGMRRVWSLGGLAAAPIIVWLATTVAFYVTALFDAAMFQALVLATVIGLSTRSVIAGAGPVLGWLGCLLVREGFAAWGDDRSWTWLESFWFPRGLITLKMMVNAVCWHGATAGCLWVWAQRRRAATSAELICSRCGYALTGLTNPAACPECGAGFGSSPRSGAGT